MTQIDLRIESSAQQTVAIQTDDGHLLKLSELTRRGIRKDNPVDSIIISCPAALP